MERIFEPMRALKFVTFHMFYNLVYTDNSHRGVEFKGLNIFVTANKRIIT